MSTRADIVAHGDFYLVPLAKVGDIKQLLDDCVHTVVAGEQTATLIFDTDKQCLLAAGYETTRVQSYTSPEGENYTWDERLLVIRSTSDVKGQMTKLKGGRFGFTITPRNDFSQRRKHY